MTLIFRRTKQRYQQGTDGVISNVQGQVTGTAGQCFNSNTGTNNADRNKFYTTERTFTSSDLGRYIMLSGSPPTTAATNIGINRHDSVPFRIIEIVSVTGTNSLIRLEGATFQDAGTNISWTLMAAAQFTSSSANFPANSITGAGPVVNQSISLPNPVSTQRELKLVPWIVGRRIDATNLLISDWTGLIVNFPTASSLSWFLHDRQALNRFDLGIMMFRFMLAAGWTTLGAQATGSVIIPAGGQSAITDGKVVRIWDGTQKLIFEFTTGTESAGHIKVPMTGGDDQPTVLASFVSKVNEQSGFKITAFNNGTTAINGSTTAGKAVLYATTANNDTSDTQRPASVIASFAPENGVDETVGTAPYSRFTNPNLSADVNEPITTDTVTPFVVAGMSGGQHRGQYRGRQTNGAGFQFERDVIYFSEGEAGATGANPKRMWSRIIEVEDAGASNPRVGFDFAMWQGWSPEYSNGASVTMGNGINPCRMNNAGSSCGYAKHATATNGNTSSGPSWGPTSLLSSFIDDDSRNTAPNVLRIRGGQLYTHDYVFCGDKDEVHLTVSIEAHGGNWTSFGAIQEVQQNPRRFMLRAAVTSGSNKVLNIGPVNPQTLSPPYQVGDVIQIAGTQVLAGAPVGGERVETATITAFGTTGTDSLDYTITVNALSGASYAIGAMVGEEAMPMFTNIGPHGSAIGSSLSVVLQNSSQYGDATNLDYNGGVSSTAVTGSTLIGFTAYEGFGTLGTNTVDNVSPNRRGGRWGIVPLVIRNTTNNEFRGRLRYNFYASPDLAHWQWVEDRNGNWYMVVPEIGRKGVSYKPVLGPVSVYLAKPYP